ncbi:PH domain-containing protein [Wohlfahrtiimonas chitiniclastica]|uniref:YdbS-like PH domain-containing protein n=1 Tax=Wohlfahrtiimonas chitiniclastica SH04 TaxID=1261130 RepID=L8XZA8_9GAMM|nr:PH domain-containing protein [Wohlfahrtiimonas chitiniclastica]ELV07636.1 Hypothetical protein F387_01440 [Wohlfahrtiimonas chitiniclastica SH04]MBS7818563.1 PH domain-containing protein [Wohlfahrtiimonas chitiniclastica]MBS7826711.1 PH domain-containing protein [Wohlfahrtiimonas chitiniclastica]
MFLNHREEELAHNESLLLSQYTHWWIFVVPGLWLLAGIYLALNAALHGSFSLYSLLMWPAPQSGTGLGYTVQSYLAMGSEVVQAHLPHSMYEFLNGIRLHPRKWLSQLVLLYALYRLVRATLTFLTTKVMVTDQRILVVTGLFRPQRVEFPRLHVDAFHIKKGFLSRFMDVGTLIIQASGGLTARLPAIKMPEALTTCVVENEK